MDKQNQERVAAYRKWVQDNLGSTAHGYAETEVVYKGMTYRVGQTGPTPYDALVFLSSGVSFMQKELGVAAPALDVKAPKDPGPHSAGQASEVLETMQIDTITLGAGGDHPYWIIKGGKWTKHGVICWPEILESAGLLDKLDPFKENKFGGGWQATYLKKDNGNPDKVVEIIQGR